MPKLLSFFFLSMTLNIATSATLSHDKEPATLMRIEVVSTAAVEIPYGQSGNMVFRVVGTHEMLASRFSNCTEILMEATVKNPRTNFEIEREKVRLEINVSRLRCLRTTGDEFSTSVVGQVDGDVTRGSHFHDRLSDGKSIFGLAVSAGARGVAIIDFANDGSRHAIS